MSEGNVSRRGLLGVAGLAVSGAALPLRRPRAATAPVVTVFADSTLVSALDAVIALYHAATRIGVQVLYSPSSVLADTLERHATADLYLPASLAWMERARRARLIRPATQRAFLTSTLVLFAQRGNAPKMPFEDGVQLAEVLAPAGKLAICNPDVIESGADAVAALQATGQWPDVQGSIVVAIDERALRSMVANGEAVLGMAFNTDVTRDARLDVFGVLPNAVHPPVIYPAALTTAAVPSASGLLDFLSNDPASTVFARYGYGLVGSRT
jgi:molybdate transport system substrate-binding protein